MDLSAQLLQMIHNVSLATDVRTAAKSLLQPLLAHLEMEQAALCELRDGELNPIFAMDRTRQILNVSRDQLWLSKTLSAEALAAMEPVVHVREGTDSVSRSIHHFELRQVVVLPVSKNPDWVVHLASQKKPVREIETNELDHLRIAAKAAILALQQQRNLLQLREQNQGLVEKLKTSQRHLLHASPAMGAIVEQVKRVAPFNISLLLQGQSGSGKEEVALLVHQLSGRSGRFIAVNCANFSESLVESELFGHVKGAFTGAHQAKEGLLKEADDGTFFLDEIGDLPLALQSKLLRVLQERVVRPIGSARDIPINVRFIAASHKCLWTLVQEKRFREDLYYRVQELVVTVPPLCARPEDISLLANYFVRHFSAEFKLPLRKISSEAERTLLAHTWPGNVRELKNVCRMAVVLSGDAELEPKDFRIGVPTAARPLGAEMDKANVPESAFLDEAVKVETRLNPESDLSLRSLTEDFERQIIRQLLERKGATQATVARQLGISIRTLQRSLN